MKKWTIWIWIGQRGSKHEEIFLYLVQPLVQIRVHTFSPDHSNHGVELVDSPIGPDAGVVLKNPLWTKQACHSLIAGLGVDFQLQLQDPVLVKCLCGVPSTERSEAATLGVDFTYTYNKQISRFGQCRKPSNCTILAFLPQWQVLQR